MGMKLTAYVKEASSAPSVVNKDITVPDETAKDLEGAYQAWVGNHAFVVKAEFDDEKEVKPFFDVAHYWAYHRGEGRVRVRKIADPANSKTVQVFRICDLPTEAETAQNVYNNAKSLLSRAKKEKDAAKIAEAETKLADAIVRAKAAGIEVK